MTAGTSCWNQRRTEGVCEYAWQQSNFRCCGRLVTPPLVCSSSRRFAQEKRLAKPTMTLKATRNLSLRLVVLQGPDACSTCAGVRRTFMKQYKVGYFVGSLAKASINRK